MGRENSRLRYRESLPLAQILVLSFISSKTLGLGGRLAPLFCKWLPKQKAWSHKVGFPNLHDKII